MRRVSHRPPANVDEVLRDKIIQHAYLAHNNRDHDEN